MLRKTFNRTDFNQIKDAVENDSNIKKVRLVILGKNEIIGLQELMDNQKRRVRTVECISRVGLCYYISKD